MVKRKKRVRGPLRDWLAGQLRSQIEAGRYPPGSLLAPERELCDSFHVSRVSVRAAIDSMVRAGLVERYPRRGTVVVGQAGTSESPVRQREQILYVRWAYQHTGMAMGVQKFFEEAGMELVVMDAHESHDTFLQYLQHPGKDIRGMVLTATDIPEYAQAVRNLIEQGIAVVCLGSPLSGLEVPSVSPDYFASGFLAADHLLRQRRRPVFFLGDHPRPLGIVRRREGWQAAMADHGFYGWEPYSKAIPLTTGQISLPALVVQSGYELASDLFRQGDSISGWSILAVNDHLARGVYQAAEEAGLVIGKEVAVVGGGDLPFARELHPPLSTVGGMSQEQIGYAAARLLYQRLTEGSKRIDHQALPVQLIARESSLGII